MSVSVIVDGDRAVVEPSPDELAETARKLLAAAKHPWDVQVTIGKRLGFRVPASLVDALGLIDVPAVSQAPEGGNVSDSGDGNDQAGEPETRPDPPTGNASRAAWAEFLDSQGIAYKDDDGRDDLRELWANRS